LDYASRFPPKEQRTYTELKITVKMMKFNPRGIFYNSANSTVNDWKKGLKQRKSLRLVIEKVKMPWGIGERKKPGH